jgi:DNA (cytosine-5)-methyltransferase 1
MDFPKPTHAKPSSPLVKSGALKPWNGARKIIDWSIPGASMFARDRALSANTVERIADGVRRFFTGEMQESFIVVLRRHCTAQSIDAPIPTVAAQGTHLALAQTTLTPFVCANRSNNVPRDVDNPVPVINTATGGGLFLVEPVVQGPFILGQHGGSVARSIDEPLSTIATAGYVRAFYGTTQEVGAWKSDESASAEEIERTLREAGYDGSVPLERVVIKDGKLYVLDILFRMLQPHELALGQDFGSDYHFAGNKTQQNRQIGNAVPVAVAEALYDEALRSLGLVDREAIAA